MESPNISVGILTHKTIELVLNNSFRLDTEVISGACKVTVLKDQLLLETDSGQEQLAPELVIQPTNMEECSFEVKNVTIGVGFHWEQQENQVFRGALRLVVNNNKVTVVNDVPLEEYLVSVISSEMKADSSLALLKAHAIMSRSWLLAQINKQSVISNKTESYQAIFESETEYIRWYDREDHSLFHVCADDHCQRYQGITRAQNVQVAKAVEETKGQVLMSNGEIADARFSKCCGGVSEVFENCWEPVSHTYLQPVLDQPQKNKVVIPELKQEKTATTWLQTTPDAFCNTKDAAVLKQVLNDYDHQAKDFYRWTVTYTQSELSELLRRRSGRDFGEIIDLIPVERGASGRLIRLKIVGSKLTLTVGKELEIRRWLSESHLYSSAFIVEKLDSDELSTSFTLRGGGWGHGVGLCQIGAAVMGHKGYSFEAILAHYFVGANVVVAYQ